MPKTAVIIVGRHSSGKSRLINLFLKPLCKMSPHQRYATVNGKRIWIKSQTLQEANQDISRIAISPSIDSLVLPSWTMDESQLLVEIVSTLETKGFTVTRIPWSRAVDDAICKDIANKIFNLITQ